MSILSEDTLITTNPATGARVGSRAATPTSEVEAIVRRAGEAQAGWQDRPWKERRAALTRWRRILSRDRGRWADLIRDEIGKPRVEAMAGDVLPTLDGLRWTERYAGRLLRGSTVGPSWQRMLLIGVARQRPIPFGVVGIIGTWNYPLFLNATAIAQALAAGNAVVWKPSELATATGMLLQEGIDEAGFPTGLVAPVFGGADVGRALIDAGIRKAVFTGGVAGGRRVLAACGELGIPAVAELSGFDPAIVLPDAPLGSTASCIAWAAFVGCGQTCVAVKRVYVVGDPRPWAEELAAAANALRVGDPSREGTDVGPMITDGARARFDDMIKAAVRAGARVIAGGEAPGGPGWFYRPTVLLGETPDAEAALAGAFGPVVLVRGVPDADSAVAAANASEFALGASVWGKDRTAARAVARRLLAGSVSINDAVTPTAHAGAPFGGFRSSGYGRTHGAEGLREFVQMSATFERPAGGFRPQLYPYGKTRMVKRMLDFYCRLFHPAA
ncbi:Benzaldehyde dehydrogenase [NAD(+)] [Aquisphaera giovannonii]|uniref:Benzaldehyde dehydrogenase [NAD(+)] n=1 Tax=Aquisphaera giovannonii TaxID=406548 RepID=A0A5B9W1J5_9BACT|nr:aldehyde dehydrogenase family protein [Aquisphaera giovannonii]QEH33875.1 Benzaldehyde dehydrogenase [NAD(+)] [Aquisphaera giovannonii]